MTFCIAIEANLNTDVCPLAKGDCYWQNRETKKCCYSEVDMSPEEYAVATSAKVCVTQISLDNVKACLRQALVA